LEPPRILGYELTEVVASRPEVETWRGRDARKRDIVLKCFTVRGSDVVRYAARAISACTVHHPGFATMTNRGKSGERAFVVRDYFTTPLAPGGLDGPGKLRAMLEVGRALEHCHAHGFVHGAVKPSNVFMAEGGQAVLADPALMAPAPSEFAAPEQTAAEPASDARTDQHALATLYAWLISGRVPKGAAPVGDGSSPLDQALSRALSPDPANRFPSLDLLLDAFEGALAGAGAPDDTRPPLVTRSGDSIHVQVVARWTPQTVAACVREISRALAEGGAHTIGYQFDVCSGSHSAAIEALATLHRERRAALKRVGFCSDTPHARGMGVLVGSRVYGLPWKAFGSLTEMQSWLQEARA
jgi:hypothetical protein